jgi:hypothetical protein
LLTDAEIRDIIATVAASTARCNPLIERDDLEHGTKVVRRLAGQYAANTNAGVYREVVAIPLRPSREYVAAEARTRHSRWQGNAF